MVDKRGCAKETIGMENVSPLRIKSYEFAKQIVFLYIELTEKRREYVMSKQLNINTAKKTAASA